MTNLLLMTPLWISIPYLQIREKYITAIMVQKEQQVNVCFWQCHLSFLELQREVAKLCERIIHQYQIPDKCYRCEHIIRPFICVSCHLLLLKSDHEGQFCQTALTLLSLDANHQMGKTRPIINRLCPTLCAHCHNSL